MIGYHWLHVKAKAFGPVKGVQLDGPAPHEFWEAATEHLSQPEGFVMLGGYLTLTWMLRLMPDSYYSFEGGVDWAAVAAQLLLQDAVQFFMHWMEHKIDAMLGWSGWFYRSSHKPHHRFTNPKLDKAFATIQKAGEHLPAEEGRRHEEFGGAQRHRRRLGGVFGL